MGEQGLQRRTTCSTTWRRWLQTGPIRCDRENWLKFGVKESLYWRVWLADMIRLRTSATPMSNPDQCDAGNWRRRPLGTLHRLLGKVEQGCGWPRQSNAQLLLEDILLSLIPKQTS